MNFIAFVSTRFLYEILFVFQVRLTSTYKQFDDASGGPLKEGEFGILLEDDQSYKPYCVEANGQRWWYLAGAIEAVPAHVDTSHVSRSSSFHQGNLVDSSNEDSEDNSEDEAVESSESILEANEQDLEANEQDSQEDGPS